jgi:hypothetical protein
MTEIDVRDAGEDDLTRPPRQQGQPGRTSSGRAQTLAAIRLADRAATRLAVK